MCIPVSRRRLGFSLPLDYHWLIGLRILESIGHLGLVTTVPALMLAYLPQRLHGRALAFWSTFFGAAFALSALGYNILGPDRAVLLERLHLLLLMPGIIAIVAIPPALAQPRWPHSVAALIMPVRKVGPTAWLLALMFLLHAGLFTSALAMSSRVLAIDLGVAGDTARSFAPVFPLIALATAAMASAVSERRVGFRLEIGLALVVTGFVAAHLFPATLAPFGFCLAFGGLGVVQAHMFGSVAKTASTGEQVSIANGLLAMFGNIGNIAFPLAVAAAFDMTGSHWFGMVAAGCATCIWLVSRRVQRFMRMSHAI